MIKLQKTTDQQTITFIPRFYVQDQTYNVKITAEEEGTIVHNEDTQAITAEKYYYQYTAAFEFRLDATYILEISLDNEIIYRDRIFVTNQTGEYSINDEVYQYKSTPQDSTENEFKLYS